MTSAGATIEPQRRRPLTLPELDSLFGLGSPYLDRDSEAIEHLADLDRAGSTGAALVRR